MKNKGFTLVELLAVIVILGLILGIAIPKATKTLEQKKQHLYELTINELIETSKKYVTSNPKIYSDISKYGSSSINVKTLCEEKLIDCPVTDPRNKESITGSIKIEYLNNEYVYTFSNDAEGIILAFDLNGGTASDAGFNENLTVQPYELVSYPSVAKTDFRLKNWSLVSGDAEILTEGIKTRSRNSVVKAIWVKDVLVTLNLNGGETTQTLNSSYETYEQIKLENPTRKNYTFIGWKIESGDSILAGNNLVVGTSATTITALWKLNTINLSVDLQGGAIEIDPSGAYDIGEDIVLKKPIKHGYTFSHWQVVNGNSILSGNVITMGTQATTIKAVWTENISLAVNLAGGETTQKFEAGYGPNTTLKLVEPTRHNYIFAGWEVISGDAIISGNILRLGTVNTAIKAKWLLSDGEFAATNKEYEFTVAVTGYYRLEAWGAQGGSASSGRGGFGGYTTGLAYLTKGTKLYINVGGQGANGTAVNTKYQGGYNGGGSGKGGSNYISAGGGGATHIAVKSGLLSTLETSLQDVLIVAGGGGGAGYYTGGYYGHGGEGGGLQGNSGVIMGNTDGATAVGIGGTQTTGASFGQGANNGSNGPGGGGGFYGGTSANTTRGAGGGSGYVGVLDEAETYGYDGSVSEEAQSYSAKKGNGYAKITYVGKHEKPTITTVGNSLVFERPTHYEVEITKSGYYNLEAWGAQGGNANTGTYRGGYGSYTEGVAYLEAGTILHIYVGGKGQNVYYNKQSATGGYNGGGNSSGGNNYMAAAGGGATHIATKKGLLETLSDSLQDVLIIAGAGGGGGYYTGGYYGFGGDGGGLQGNKGTIGGNTDGNTSVGTGGTQIAATNSVFGRGYSGETGAGGGSGYYGGTASGAYRGGGGGSSYIGNVINTSSETRHTTCYNCQETQADNTRTKKVATSSQIAKEDTPKQGHGYAKITLLYETEPIITLGANESKTFEYTGTYKIVEIQKDGYYRLEAWGAQGGSATSGRGGFGGYTTGLKYLTKGTKLYVYVGGQGANSTANNAEYQGGYNGGGSGKGGSNYMSAGGGGATHIATKKGLLSTLQTSLKDVLIVAGGGGGAGYYTGGYYGHGGEGGGLQGNSGVIMGNTDGVTTVGMGGSANNWSTFGQGANNTSNGPGGGGGLYGGKTANTYRGAGGGSGYVGKLLEAETYGYDGTVSEKAQGYSAKTGNGYAKITYIGNRETPTITTVGNSLVFERPTQYTVNITKTGNYKLEVWGAQGGNANTGTYRGGYGSYSVGVANLKAGTTLYVYVGGKGQNVYYNRQVATGGYNGGGNSHGGNNYMAATGGGATHIAIEEGLLSKMSSKTSKILIVAGGGGGGGYYTGGYYGFGGDAGGIQGNKGTIGGNTDGNTSVGTGGTQTGTTNSYFGEGKSGTSGAGGGSGYYGGTASGAYRGAGGGSGYIGNSLLISSNGVTKHMICYGTSCKTSTAAGTLTNSVTVVSSTATADTAKMGNGFAKITLLSE